MRDSMLMRMMWRREEERRLNECVKCHWRRVRGASTAASHWPVSEFSRCGGFIHGSGHPTGDCLLSIGSIHHHSLYRLSDARNTTNTSKWTITLYTVLHLHHPQMEDPRVLAYPRLPFTSTIMVLARSPPPKTHQSLHQ